MKLIDIDKDQIFLPLKHCLITICCAFVIGVGYFIFIEMGKSEIDFVIGISHIVIGSLATISCIYEFIVYPYLKQEKV